MRKINLILIISLCLLALSAKAEKKYACYGIGFYNQENLFDTCHDEESVTMTFFQPGLTVGMASNTPTN